jgi:hypothetical protein
MQRPQIVGQRPKLRLVRDIAPEEDIARRLRFAEEGALVRSQGFAGKAEDNGFHGTNGSG